MVTKETVRMIATGQTVGHLMTKDFAVKAVGEVQANMELPKSEQAGFLAKNAILTGVGDYIVDDLLPAFKSANEISGTDAETRMGQRLILARVLQHVVDEIGK